MGVPFDIESALGITAMLLTVPALAIEYFRGRSKLWLNVEFSRQVKARQDPTIGSFMLTLYNPGPKPTKVEAVEVVGLGLVVDEKSMRNTATMQGLHLPFLLRAGHFLQVRGDLSLREHRLGPGPLVPVQVVVATDRSTLQSRVARIPLASMAASA